jgi:hypothetical protein
MRLDEPDQAGTDVDSNAAAPVVAHLDPQYTSPAAAAISTTEAFVRDRRHDRVGRAGGDRAWPKVARRH